MVMRVVHVTPYFAPAFCYGGPPRSVLALCRELERQGVDVEVVTTTANGKGELRASPPGGEEYEGVRVHYLPRAFARRYFGARHLRALLSSALERCDVVHLHGLWNIPVAVAAHMARQREVPYVVSTRGMMEKPARARHPWRKRLAYWLLERRNLAGASLLHATSAAEAATLRQLGLGVRIVTVPNGVEAAAANATLRGVFRHAWRLGAETPLVAYLGRIHPVKRIDLLVAAFARLNTRHPEARLVIAGPDEEGYGEKLRRRLGPERDRIVWTGPLEMHQKRALLADATALALCSDSESFSLAVAEALAAGVPVVVTRTCPWESVERYGCGFWVEQRADAIAEAILALIRDPAGARAMGERGRILVHTQYSWERIAKQMASCYAQSIEASAIPRKTS